MEQQILFFNGSAWLGSNGYTSLCEGLVPHTDKNEEETNSTM